ncbi:hypothetical protein FQN49_001761, partial [Arthroderma sp. PD_2]
MPVAAWERLLHDTGFSGIDAVFQDRSALDLTMSITCSSRVGKQGKSQAITVCGPFMEDDEVEFAQMVADTISDQLGCPTETEPFADIEAADDSYHIFIDSPRHSVIQNMSPDKFESLQNKLLHNTGLLWVILEGIPRESTLIKARKGHPGMPPESQPALAPGTRRAPHQRTPLPFGHLSTPPGWRKMRRPLFMRRLEQWARHVLLLRSTCGLESLLLPARTRRGSFYTFLGTRYSQVAHFSSETAFCAGGKGVEVIVHSIGGELLSEICALSAKSGRFVEDNLFENSTFEYSGLITQPRVQGARNLHELMPDNLDFFAFSARSSAIQVTVDRPFMLAQR